MNEVKSRGSRAGWTACLLSRWGKLNTEFVRNDPDAYEWMSGIRLPEFGKTILELQCKRRNTALLPTPILPGDYQKIYHE